MRTATPWLKIGLALTLSLAAVAGSAQVCIDVDDPVEADPSFEFEVTARAGDYVTLAGRQLPVAGFVEQPVYGGGIFRPADDLAQLSWSKQGNELFESFRCDLDLGSGTGTGKRTSADDTGTTIVDVTCSIIAC